MLVLTTACQVADIGRSDRELADVIEEWDRPGADLARDAWIAEDSGGETIGYAFVAPPDAEVRVHPRARGRGLGEHLRELLEARAAELGAGELAQRATAGDRAAERPLELAGYEPLWQTWRLERPLDVAPEPPNWPAGVTPTPLDDERRRRRGARAARARRRRRPGRRRRSRSTASTPSTSPTSASTAACCVLATAATQLVGAAICESWNDTDGIVVQLATDPRRAARAAHARTAAGGVRAHARARDRDGRRAVGGHRTGASRSRTRRSGCGRLAADDLAQAPRLKSRDASGGAVDRRAVGSLVALAEPAPQPEEVVDARQHGHRDGRVDEQVEPQRSRIAGGDQREHHRDLHARSSPCRTGSPRSRRPAPPAAMRIAVTANSRAMITIATHAASRCSETSEMSAAMIRSLSAIGSISLPNVVTALRVRAR